MRCLPVVNPIYWATLIVASIFGTTTGDFVSDVLGFGHLRGIPILLAALVAVFVAERLVPLVSALFFWVAIIVVRTLATNVADSFLDHGIWYSKSILGTAALLAVAVLAYAARRARDGAPGGAMRVDAIYWNCMALAGILGTLAGDYTSFARHMGTLPSTLLWGAGVGAMFLLARGRLTLPLVYWATVVLIRAAGTAAGDFIAEQIGLVTATLATGMLFAALVVYLYEMRGENRAVA